MKIGIYGGSFDPIHTGHAIVANFVSQCNVVDEVWITVSRRNPLKSHTTVAGDKQRLEMASLVATKCKNVNVCDIEMSLPTPSYTYATLKHLQEKYPDDEFFCIVGSDSLDNFQNWRNHDEILKEFGLIVYPRPEFPLPQREPDNIIFLQGAPEFSISSTLIREYIKSGWNINFFTPPEVAKYIRVNKLYQ